MKWLFVFFLATMLVPNPCFSQNQEIAAADTFKLRAIRCLEKGQGDSSIFYHNNALKTYAAKDSLRLWLKSHVQLAYTWAGKHKQAFVGLDLLERAIQSKPREPKTIEEWEQYCLMFAAKAYIYEEYANGDFNSAKTEYERGFQIFKNQLGEKNDKVAQYLYYKFGNVCSRLGDYERGRVLLQTNNDYAIKYRIEGMPKYGDLALALIELGKNEEALQMLQKALSEQNSSAESTITIRRSQATAYLNLGRTADAAAAANFIPGLVKKAQLETLDIDEAYYLSGYYSLLAEIQDVQKNYKTAVSHYETAIKLETQTWGTTQRREVAKIYERLGDLQLRNNDFDAALHNFQKALSCVLSDFKPNADSSNPHDSLFYAENTIMDALEGKAKTFFALGQLENALHCYELIPIVEAKIRANHSYESSKLLALSESRQRFDAAISIAWQLYERNKNDRRYADRAFRLTELARGMLLLQSLAQAHANYHLPEELRNRENVLNAKLAWYDHEIAEEMDAGAEGDRARLARLQKELFDLKNEFEKFKIALRKQFPDYAALSDQIHFLESSAVTALLRSKQALLDFYLTEKSLFVFSFNKKGDFNWRRADLPEGFRTQVLKFVEYLQKGDEEDKLAAEAFRSFAYTLYELLLAPELQRLLPESGNLLIVPDDALVFVPFEVLLRKPAIQGNWRDLPWLIKNYNTGYAYSATLLQMQEQISAQHQAQKEPLPFSFGGYAPSYSTAGRYKLSNTEAMVKAAQQLFGGQTWCGEQATEEQFKASAPQCRILLLAMHGIADAEHPELSSLLFGDPGADSLSNNNVLYSSELQIMQLQADLAVLSACHSGFGQIQKGEGVSSLARAFARAGVPATFMSLWLLQENAASPLVQSFLEYLKRGYTKDKALRLAKLDFLNKDAYFEMGHPFYWAGVTVSGDMCALDFGGQWKYRAAALAVALLLGGFWWKKKRSSASR